LELTSRITNSTTMARAHGLICNVPLARRLEHDRIGQTGRVTLGQDRRVQQITGQPHRPMRGQRDFDFEHAATVDTQGDLPGDADD
jgi:hypothetical protein